MKAGCNVLFLTLLPLSLIIIIRLVLVMCWICMVGVFTHFHFVYSGWSKKWHTFQVRQYTYPSWRNYIFGTKTQLVYIGRRKL